MKKVTSLLFIVAIFGSTLFVSCTPENIEDGTNPQQVDGSKIIIPQNG